ncbi:MAG: translation initiation factor IF-2 [Saprospiraceae bacterium]|nr:translation initiation factor IF-2 [Saprospiraceae bacterium]
MEKQLIKVAKEFNIGKDSIVEYLAAKGFEIENKPNAKVTEEMYNVLLKHPEFKNSIKDKVEADLLKTRVIPVKKETTPVTTTTTTESTNRPSLLFKREEPVQPEPATSTNQATNQTPQDLTSDVIAADDSAINVEKINVEQEKVEEPTTQPDIHTTERTILPKLKILGKIDLEAKSKKKESSTSKKEKATPKVTAEAPQVEETLSAEPIVEEQEITQHIPEAPTTSETIHPPVDEIIETEVFTETSDDTDDDSSAETVTDANQEDYHKAEVPQLKGLKILGKIDTSRFDPASKKKEKKKELKQPVQNKGTQATGTDKTSAQSIEDEKRKRKRKRKKLSATAVDTSKQISEVTTEKSPPQLKKASSVGLPTLRAPGSPSSSGGYSRGADRKNQNKGDRFKPKEEVREISQKEIDEQMKATLARLNLGGKSKRAKNSREKRERNREKLELEEMQSSGNKLQVTEFVTVSELASLMNIPVSNVITACLSLGIIVSINQRLDAEIIELLGNEFDHEIEFITAEDQVSDFVEEPDAPEDLKPRAPIVTVMGHVDHGKTSLLDYIRSANVVSGEAGGITQHIGAYEVSVNGKKITFLDTPGHEAFTAMRARGAKITDVAVIIVAADDNVMPQTKEAISHAQAAGVPIIFAINKIDKEGAAPEKIKQELAAMNFLVEDWGGKYQSQDISAKKGINVDKLLEKILLEAEMLDLHANPDRRAVGTVIEASLDKGRGYVAKMLVQNGTLSVGDSLVAGEHSGKIKALFNERGKKIKSAGPSSPILVLGLGGAPQAGETFKVMENEQESRQLASKRAQINREQATRANKRISLDEIGRRLALGTFKELKLIVKGDVDGSIEALTDALIKLSVEKVQVTVIHKAVGQIIESDVLLASASDAIIVGFQVRPSPSAKKLAEKEGVQIRTYSIIYEALEEIKSAIEGMLEPTKEENIIGQVEIREVFKLSRVGSIAGCYVLEGKIARSSSVRLIRDGIVIYPTKAGASARLGSLKRFKEDVKEVKSGMECGLTVENYNDIKVGDIVEVFEIIEVKQRLD